jgi:methylated-DNA-protein-cysteine methyltransferase-like protein
MLPALNFYEAVYRVVRDIPRGRVMTYGQIATILGAPRAARAVGYAMKACAKGVPWQRVINSKGGVSPGGTPDRPTIQRRMLKKEGIKFSADDTCNLDVFQWHPRNPGKYAYARLEELPFL